ncbi:MAG: phospholipase D family protein [Casimicrobiaceae bacterium]
MLRTQLIAAAERTIDIQYFIFAEDHTGKLLQQSILAAADRGVRVRMLVDDTNSFGERSSRDTLTALSDHRNIELRLFNPFHYRGDVPALRLADTALSAPRVNRRMHNKLFVVDNAMAIVGGRNVADEYYGVGTSQTGVLGIPLGEAPIRFGDFDVAAVGPIVPRLSESFDVYWNSALSVPSEALTSVALSAPSLPHARADLSTGSLDPTAKPRATPGSPLAGLLANRMGFVWAKAEVVVDPPDKADAQTGESAGSPIAAALVDAISDARRDLVIVTPYFVPGQRVEAMLKDALRGNVRVRILTNSLASTDVPIAFAGYRKYRKPLIESGAELYETRAVPGEKPGGSGISGSGSDAPFALHAKLYVYDLRRVFIGSPNFDRRSFNLNTELGLMIESAELARQIVERFNRFAASDNSYRLTLDSSGPLGPRLRWQTERDGVAIEQNDDPDATPWKRAQIELYSLLPIDELL